MVTLRFYHYSENDEQVKKEAIATASKMNKERDCRASIDEIIEVPFGKLENRKVL